MLLYISVVKKPLRLPKTNDPSPVTLEISLNLKKSLKNEKRKLG
jgi:hypothetical protein